MDKYTSAVLLLFTLIHCAAAPRASENSVFSNSDAKAVASYRSAMGTATAESMRKPSSKRPNSNRARLTRPAGPTPGPDKPRLSSAGRAKGQGE